jgi:hypothetical protein
MQGVPKYRLINENKNTRPVLSQSAATRYDSKISRKEDVAPARSRRLASRRTAYRMADIRSGRAERIPVNGVAGEGIKPQDIPVVDCPNAMQQARKLP